MAGNPALSIIICTRNKGNMLLESIKAIVGQKVSHPPKIEIIIVDNSHRSIQGLDRVTFPSYMRLRHVHFRKKGISFARNYGIGVAKGSYISFVDDDTIVQMNWLSTLLINMKRHPRRVIFGQIFPVFEEEIRKQSLESIEKVTPWIFTSVKGTNTKSIWPYAVNVSIPRSVFRQHGMFSELFANEEGPVKHPYGEDPEFFQRIISRGVGLRFEKKMICEHHVGSDRLTVRYLMLRYIDDGKNSVLGYISETREIRYLRILKFIGRDTLTVIRQTPWSNFYGYLYFISKLIGECIMLMHLIRHHAYYIGRIGKIDYRGSKDESHRKRRIISAATE
jgi:glycosyltransferase involved in cell wall biosynthesis